MRTIGTIAYFAGVDPIILTKLVINGINTLPVSNGWDNHGKFICHITPEDHVCGVIGYLHKVIPVHGVQMTPIDVLFTCCTHKIPVYLAAPAECIKEAKDLIAGTGENVEIVTPDELYDKAMRCLKQTVGKKK